MKLKNIWWILLIRGIALLIFGLIAVFWPVITFVTLAFVFAFYILLSGVFNLIYSITGMHSHRYWFLVLILGLFEIGVGVYAINHPGINIAALTLLIGFTFMIRGVFEIIAAFDDIFAKSHSVLLTIGGVLSLLVGLLILRYPIAGSISFTWVLGFYALVAGSILVALSFSAKDLIDEITGVVNKRTRK